jgi:hypothetical protein
MTNTSRRYHLLLLSLLVAFVTSFTVTVNEANLSSAFLSISSASAENDHSTENSILANVDDVAIQQTILSSNLHHSFTKWRKKYKRLSSASAGIRLPVKHIETIAFDINAKDFYIKPFFLSRLHSFLFRLTPF